MKKIILILISLLLLSSCSSSVFKGDVKTGDDYICIVSDSFNGEKKYEMNVKSDVEATMELSVEEGALSIIVENSTSKPLEGNYTKEWNQYGKTTFTLEKGTYEISTKGKDFKGTCEIGWKAN